MSGQQRQRERERKRGVGGGEQQRGQKNENLMLQPGLLRIQRRGERKEWDRGLDAAQTDWPSRNSRGPSEDQQEPGSTERFSIRTRKLHNRVKSCSYTNIRRNKSLCKSHRRPKQETH